MWQLPRLSKAAAFYTCARPGRSLGSHVDVPDDVVVQWARGLPGGGEVVVVSLLGKKPNGKDEHSFYSFFNRGWSLQDWLADKDIGRVITILEHPTVDSTVVPKATLDSIAHDIMSFLGRGRIVVVMDSGGVQRTGAVCRHLGAAPISEIGWNERARAVVRP